MNNRMFFPHANNTDLYGFRHLTLTGEHHKRLIIH